VELKQAWHVLGIAPSDDPDEIRSAYTRRLFELHPDLSTSPDANEATVELNAAYADVMADLHTPGRPPTTRSRRGNRRNAPEPAGRTSPGAAGGTPHAAPREVIAVAQLADDTIGIGAPGPEAFAAALDAAHRLGEVTYVEPGSGLVQVLVEFVDGPICQLLMTFQGRATGVTEVFFTIESIDDRPAPPIDAVTELMVHTLTDRPDR
jgi:hypothetical protein